MANSVTYQEKKIGVGDTIVVSYKIKEKDKTRVQKFRGIVLKIRGDKERKMITVRKNTKYGVAVERIFPLPSPWIENIKVEKVSNFRKAHAFFIRDLSEKEIKRKLYRNK